MFMEAKAALRAFHSIVTSPLQLSWFLFLSPSTFLGPNVFIYPILLRFISPIPFRLSHNFYSKMSAYFRGSNPYQADFMQQGISSSVSCTLVPVLRLNFFSGRALLKLERANLERRAAFVA
jgi:hypothetical protein